MFMRNSCVEGSAHLPQYRATCNKPCCVCVRVWEAMVFTARPNLSSASNVCNLLDAWNQVRMQGHPRSQHSEKHATQQESPCLRTSWNCPVIGKSSATNGHKSRSCWWEEWKGTGDTMGTTALIFWECGNCVGWAAQSQHAAVNIRRHNAMLTPKELLYLLHLCPRERVHVHPHTHTFVYYITYLALTDSWQVMLDLLNKWQQLCRYIEVHRGTVFGKK